MNISKNFYDFLKGRTWDLTEKWYKNLNKDLTGIYSTQVPEEIHQLKTQNHLFHEKFIDLFQNASELDIQKFDDFIDIIVNDNGHQRTPLKEILGEFFHQQYLYLEALQDFVDTYPGELTSKQIFEYNAAILKAINDIILKFTQEFMDRSKKRLRAQHEMIIELSSPIIKLTKNTALLPLIGEIDTERSKMILEQALQQCSEMRITRLYIDLLGVPVVDTMVAQQLFQMISALKLIGVDTSLSGVRPSIALTSIQLGIDFKDVETFGSIEQAMNKNK